MAARGARSRKIVEKQIRKEEDKQAVKDHRDTFGHRKDLKGGSSTPKPLYPAHRPATSQDSYRRPSVLSSGVSVRSNESGNSKTSSAVDKLSAKFSQSTNTANSKFVGSTGRSTLAPRGRNGGVPVKSNEVRNGRQTRQADTRKPSINSSTSLSITPTESSAPSLTGPTTERSWENTKIWVGDGQPAKPYPGFEHEPDLWMNDGNCAIFFHEETDLEEPKATLRIHSVILERARSAFMTNLLKYGEIVPEEEGNGAADNSRADHPRVPAWPLTSASLGSLDQLLTNGDGKDPSINDFPAPPMTPDLASGGSQTFSDYDGHTYVEDTPRRSANGGRMQSGRTELTAQTIPEDLVLDGEQRITHEIWFRCPSHIKNKAVQRRHNMATRNFIALLYGLPIIGNDYYEMLSDLQHVLDTYYELNEPAERLNTAAVITQYIMTRKLDDVRNDLSAALGLLAWCEQPEVEWEAGYLEAFVHAVGMISEETFDNPDFQRNLTPETRHRLKTAFQGLQSKVADAEDRLETFNFEELWYVDGIDPEQAAQSSFEAFREFLYHYYEAEYGKWPPSPRNYQSRWLSRDLVQRLQIDFGSLYDYLVDHDVVWEATEERHTRRWTMISKHPRGLLFTADRAGLPLTNMLVGFDSSQRHDHIPHPYPLLPDDKSTAAATKTQDSKKTLFNKLKRTTKEAPAVPDAKHQYQMALAFNGATNSTRVGSHFEENKLIEAFSNYEKSAVLPNVSPVDGRLGRWVLLYGILETLSTISVDTGGLKFSDGVRYFISPSLDGIPGWRSEGPTRLLAEACQQRSYCWLAPKVWTETSRAQQQGGIPMGTITSATTAAAAAAAEEHSRQPAPGAQLRMPTRPAQTQQYDAPGLDAVQLTNPIQPLSLASTVQVTGDPPAYSGPSTFPRPAQTSAQNNPSQSLAPQQNRIRDPHPLQAPHLHHSWLPSTYSTVTTHAANSRQLGNSVTVSSPQGEFELSNGGRTVDGPGSVGLSELDGDTQLSRTRSSGDSKSSGLLRRSPSHTLGSLLGRSDRRSPDREKQEQAYQYEMSLRPRQPEVPRKPAEYEEAARERERERSQQREAFRQLEERRQTEARLHGQDRPTAPSLQSTSPPVKYSTIPSPTTTSRYEGEKIRQMYADARNPASLPVPLPLPQASGGNAFASHQFAPPISMTPLPGTNAFAAPGNVGNGLGLAGLPPLPLKSPKRGDAIALAESPANSPLALTPEEKRDGDPNSGSFFPGVGKL